MSTSCEVNLKKNNIYFTDTIVKAGSDHISFEYENIPNVLFVQENIENLVHKPTDIPETLDYKQIDRIANAISDFVETNNGIMLEAK